MADAPEAGDKLLTCVDCGVQFSFTARDQQFYEQRGFQIPRRCRTCRDKRKAGQATGAGAAAGAPAAAGGVPTGAGQGGVPAGGQFKVVCTSCGAETTVPFKPDTSRPVYCRTCYLNRRKTGQR